MSADPRDVAKHARYEKWWWVCNYLAVPAIVTGVIDSKLAIAYLAFLSIHALVLGASAKEQGAESRFPEEADG